MKDCAYAHAAYDALVKWNGYSEDQAREAIDTLSFEKIDDLTYGASKSMIDGLKSIGESLGLDETELAQFIDESLGRIEGSEVTDRVKGQLEQVLTMPHGKELADKMAVDALTAIHDGWVEREAHQFNGKKATREQQYQYLPIEMLGWHEAKSDLLFVAPALEAIGVTVDEKTLRQEYNDRAIDVLSQGELEDVILSGCNGYSQHWTQEIADAMGDSNFVANTLVPQTDAKGFGKDEILMGELDARGIEPIAPEDPSGFDTPGNR
jgi:hypothetical protein